MKYTNIIDLNNLDLNVLNEAKKRNLYKLTPLEIYNYYIGLRDNKPEESKKMLQNYINWKLPVWGKEKLKNMYDALELFKTGIKDLGLKVSPEKTIKDIEDIESKNKTFKETYKNTKDLDKKLVKKQKCYIKLNDSKKILISCKDVIIPGYEEFKFIIHKNYKTKSLDEKYIISEKTTGLSLGDFKNNTEEEVLINAKKRLDEIGKEKIKSSIDRSEKINIDTDLSKTDSKKSNEPTKPIESEIKELIKVKKSFKEIYKKYDDENKLKKEIDEYNDNYNNDYSKILKSLDDELEDLNKYYDEKIKDGGTNNTIIEDEINLKLNLKKIFKKKLIEYKKSEKNKPKEEIKEEPIKLDKEKILFNPSLVSGEFVPEHKEALDNLIESCSVYNEKQIKELNNSVNEIIRNIQNINNNSKYKVMTKNKEDKLLDKLDKLKNKDIIQKISDRLYDGIVLQINAPIGLRSGELGQDTLKKIKKSGFLKNQFETKRSEGSLGPEKGTLRDSWEKSLYDGILHKRPEYEKLYYRNEFPEQEAKVRPVYGYTRCSNIRYIDSYGDVVFELKPEVKHRTSFTLGNSSGKQPIFEKGTISYGNIPLIRNIIKRKLNYKTTDDYKKDYDDYYKYLTELVDGKEPLLPISNEYDGYNEIQILGGISVNRDIDKIVIKKGYEYGDKDKIYKNLEKLAKKYKKPLYTYEMKYDSNGKQDHKYILIYDPKYDKINKTKSEKE